jgi:hypothetical protein
MSAGPKLDGPGTVKLVALNEALFRMQAVHSMVERMAVEVKNKKSVGPMAMQLKRLMVPLIGQLKAQFQLISDQLVGMNLIAGRGGADALKIRAYRESVAQIRTQLEIAIVHVKDKHTVPDAAGEARKKERDGE